MLVKDFQITKEMHVTVNPRMLYAEFFKIVSNSYWYDIDAAIYSGHSINHFENHKLY